jgi:hypothetical protein
VAELVGDQGRPDVLEHGPADPGQNCSTDEAIGLDGLRREHSEGQNEDPDVDDEGNQNGPDPHERTVTSESGDAREDRGDDHVQKEHRQEGNAPPEAGEEPRTDDTGHVPHLGHGLLGRLRNAEGAPDQRHEPNG